MKFTGSYKYLALAASVAPFMLLGIENAGAQTTINAIGNTIQVQNAITAAKVDDLNFGVVVAIADTATAKIASIVEDSQTGGTPTVSTTGAAAFFSIVDATAAKPALLNVTQAADNATLNITITTTTAPISGGHAFTVAEYNSSWNGAATVSRTSGTKFQQTYLKAFGGGTNTLAVGAKLSTDANTYADSTYAGAFSVKFEY